MTALSTTSVLGPVDQIPPGEGRVYEQGSRMIAVFRLRDGALRAVPASCPHGDGSCPLADGQIDNTVLICPLHQDVWELATGRSLSGQPDLDVLPVMEQDGLVVAPY